MANEPRRFRYACVMTCGCQCFYRMLMLVKKGKDHEDGLGRLYAECRYFGLKERVVGITN